MRLRLAGLLRARQIQIAHAFDFYTNLTLIPAARLARVPVVIGSQRQLGDLLTPRQARAQAAAFRSRGVAWTAVLISVTPGSGEGPGDGCPPVSA